MPIPKYYQLMMPILQSLSGREAIPVRVIREKLSKDLELTDEEMMQKLPSGRGNVFMDRVGWAATYLKKAQLLTSPKRGVYQITERGIKAIQENPDDILRYLERFDEFRSFKTHVNPDGAQSEADTDSVQFQMQNQDITPDEMIENAKNIYEHELKDQLLQRLQEIDPYKFENVIVMLMEKMNYGVGSLTPKSHDGGIDGIIDEDELGLDKIYLQAKRYSDNNRVNEKEMRDFVGALATKPFSKAVFVTTSFFDQKAKQTARDAQGKNIRLIEGDELVALMIKHNIGVQTKQLIELKQLDNDFFYEE